jgi:hypothetical protein
VRLGGGHFAFRPDRRGGGDPGDMVFEVVVEKVSGEREVLDDGKCENTSEGLMKSQLGEGIW